MQVVPGFGEFLGRTMTTSLRMRRRVRFLHDLLIPRIDQSDIPSARKIEWAKSRARANRYQEEIQIVKEEMSRTLRSFVWKEAQWKERAVAKVNAGIVVAPEHAEGLRAYSERQARIWRGFHDKCQKRWSGVPEAIKRARMEAKDPKLLWERKEEERRRVALKIRLSTKKSDK